MLFYNYILSDCESENNNGPTQKYFVKCIIGYHLYVIEKWLRKRTS